MADKKSDEGEWRLASQSGESSAIDDWELVGGLSSGDIDYDAWVWRPGWGEWLRACQVEALRAAIPEQKRAPVKKPRSQPLDADPPQVPHTLVESARHTTARTPIPYTPNEANLPRISHLSEDSGGGLFRSPEPTLVDRVEAVGDQGNRTTLKPPGAVPPPPRGVPGPSPIRRRMDTPIETAADDATKDLGSKDGPLDTERDAGPPPPTDDEDTIEDSGPSPTRDVSSSRAKRTVEPSHRHEPKAAKPRRLSDRPEHSLDATLPAASGFSVLEKTPTTHRLLRVIVALGILCVVLMVTIVFLLLGRPTEAPPQPIASQATALEDARATAHPSASKAPEAPQTRVGCEWVSEARRLAGGVALDVPVSALSVNADTLAIGFARSRTHAIGMKVTWPNLDVEKVFDKKSGPALLGVVPMTASGELKFATDRVGGPLKSSHTLNTEPRISVGAVAAGFAQWTRGHRPRVVWPGGGAKPITVPRTATSARAGVAITFRRGGRGGDVMLGWLSEDKPTSEFGTVRAAGQLSGTPSVATNEQEVLVTFANRSQKSDPWRIVLGSAALGKVPARAESVSGLFTAEATAISPVAAGLGGGGWLLQWTEGSSGAYRVHLRALNKELEPVGPALIASPSDKNAGQGTVWTAGEQALSLFVVTGESEKELWARSLRCP